MPKRHLRFFETKKQLAYEEAMNKENNEKPDILTDIQPYNFYF